MGRRGAYKPKLLEAFNPDKGHVYSRYYKPHKDGTLPENRKFIPAVATDNPHISEDYIEQLRNSDPITRERLLFGNFEYDDDPSILVRNDAFEDLFTNTVDTTGKYITADIARFGKDTTRIGYWEGMKLMKVYTLTKTGIPETAEKIKMVANEHCVPYSCIIADEDGVGGGVVDILKGIKGFMGNSVPFHIWDSRQMKQVPANFGNLRHQCFFRMAEEINNHRMAIADESIREILREDLTSVRQKHVDTDGKLKIISKDEMKELIGRSPDLADMVNMRMFFLFKPQDQLRKIEVKAQSILRRRRNVVNQSY